MPRFRIRIERLDVVPDREPQWKNHVHSDGRSDYVPAPEGLTKRVSEEVYDQTVDVLDLPALVCAINTPDGFKGPA